MYKMRIHSKNITIYKAILLLGLFFGSFFFSMNIFAQDTMNFGVSIGENLQNYYNNNISNTLEEISWNAVVSDLFDHSMNIVKQNKILPMMESVNQTVSGLNGTYSCSLNSDDVFNLLYAADEEFVNAIIEINKDSVIVPTSVQVYNSCKKLNECRYPEKDPKDDSFFQSTKLQNDCLLIASAQYQEMFINGKNQFTLKNVNYWKNLFWNNDLTDSSYDILHDINNVAKLLFDNPSESSTVLFYRLPDYNNSGWGSNGFGSNNNSNWWIWNNTDSSSQDSNNDGFGDEYDWFSMDEDDEINNWNNVDNSLEWDNIWNNNWSEIGNEWSLNLVWIWEGDNNGWVSPSWNICTDDEDSLDLPGGSWSENQWQDEAENPFEKETTPLDPEEEEILNDFVDDISDIEGSLSCNNDGFCDASENSSCSDCSRENIEEQEELNYKIIEGLWDLADLSSVKSCISSCNNWPTSEILACVTRCSCAVVESPLFRPEEFPWFDPLFKIRFCIVPPSNKVFSKNTTTYSIEEIIDNMTAVFLSLRDSGQLTPQNKTREAMDQANQSYSDAWKQSSYTLSLSQRANYANESETKKAEEQVNQYKDLMNNVLKMQTDPSDLLEINKYLVEGRPNDDKTNAGNSNTISQVNNTKNKYEYITESTEESNFDDLTEYFNNEVTVTKNNSMIDFLWHNASFWWEVYNIFGSFRNTSENLNDKKQ